MPLQKTTVPINFIKGLDLKSDPFQVQVGNFLNLNNSIFTTAGRLTKRPGYQSLTTLPNSFISTTLTTLNDNLIATGPNLYALSQDTGQWLDQGTVQPVQLSTQPLVRVGTSQTSPDAAVVASGLTCLVYMDNGQGYYQISDSRTGQQIVTRTILPSGGSSPRVFALDNYFIILFITSGAILQYISIPIANPSSPAPAINFTTNSTMRSTTAGYDGYVANNTLYVSWNGTSTVIYIASLSGNLVLTSASIAATFDADFLSVTVDKTVSPLSNYIWVSFWYNGTMNGYSASFSSNFAPVTTATPIITGVDISELTTIAANSLLSIFYENINDYAAPYPGGPISMTAVRSDFISKLTVTPAVTPPGIGTASPTTVMLRSVGLASKPFFGATGTIYMLVAYGCITQISSLDNSNQPSYFLTDSLGNIIMRLAYSNGGGYAISQVLPTVNSNAAFSVAFLNNDFLAAVNKTTNPASGTPTNAIYTQTGVNLATFTINDSGQHSSEIAGALHLTGGQLWEYDGVKPVELGFQVWPENVSYTTSGAGGLITANTYNYVFTYEWTDNQGNLHRSAPSIPLVVTTTGSTSTNTLYVPTLRLTYKQPFLAPTSPNVKNPVRIVGYRWSTSQEVFYQFTSLTMPTLDDTTIDFVVITDTKSDAQILGNTILYTTGGVVEDIAPPASIDSALYGSRLFLIDAEDPNLLWYSKQVIENTPVEMSDLFTIYIAPTTGAQGSTGPMTALAAMDDKLIIFKKDAIYYITGTGPDNTGANNDFSSPIFITSGVGTSNPDSIVLTPNGLMFQSDKGIWQLGRDLSTTYIGAPVETYNSAIVQSTQMIPATTYVLFVLNNNLTLMYDYFYNQWGTHSNVSAIFSTLYQGLHTYLNPFGQVFQNAPGTYLDGSEPVLMSLTTSWINIAGLQGYERFYAANLLGTYFSPFNLNVSLAYNYNPSFEQSTIITPDNATANYGGEALWGSGGPWGGPGNVFSARLFPQRQKTQSFQMTIQEVYDPSFGQPAGEGLSLSGLLLLVGIKKGNRTQSAKKSFG